MKSKLPFIPTACAALLFTAGLSTAGAQVITDSSQFSSDTLPGDGSNYAFYGHAFIAQSLTDFSQQLLAGQEQIGTVSSIYVPASTTNLQSTGIVGNEAFFFPGPIALANYTLQSAGGSTFNLSDFNVYVMFSNDDLDNLATPTNGDRDASITLSLYESDGTTLLYSITDLVSDTNTDSTMAFFAPFNVQGGTAGDVLTLSATSTGVTSSDNVYTPNFGGISFASVAATPEPSTYAMLVAGLGVLAVFARRRRLA